MAAVTQRGDGNKTMSDEEPEGQAPETRPAPQGGGPSGPKPPVARGAAQAGGPRFFTIYKKGQGYWTRMGTALGAGFIGVMFSFELYDKIPTFLSGDQVRDRHIAMISAAIFLVAFAVWSWWYMNKPSTVDFLVATDSEMKKVNWTTRKELIGSTKIVILFMFLIAIYLFACDLIFGAFFHLTHVLRTWF